MAQTVDVDGKRTIAVDTHPSFGGADATAEQLERRRGETERRCPVRRLLIRDGPELTNPWTRLPPARDTREQPGATARRRTVGGPVARGARVGP